MQGSVTKPERWTGLSVLTVPVSRPERRLEPLAPVVDPLATVAEPDRPSTDRPVSPSPDRFLHSDPHDFAGLYIRHRSALLLHARAQLNDVRDADEVVQDAFLRLFLALPELDTELQALAYCRRTITNLCIDRYRATQRRPRLVALDSVADSQLVEDDPNDPVVQAEDAAVVRAALSQLSPLHREALVKREIEEKTLPAIAVELKIPEESVKHVLFRARRALRRLLVGTSVAPGAGSDSVGLVQRSLRDGGRLAALAAVVALALGLSAGPDLRMVPVVGNALPDLPSLAEVTAPIGDALGRLGGRVGPTAPSPDPRTLPGKSPSAAKHPAGGPLLVPADERPLAPQEVAPPVVFPTVTPEQQALATSDVANAPVAPAPEPGVQPSPAATGMPTATPTPTVEPSPTTTATPTAPATASPTATPTGSPSPTPSGSSPSPTATPTPTPTSSTVALGPRKKGPPTSATTSQ